MKKEIEIKWIVNLLTESSLKNNIFFKRGANITRFEEYAQSTRNSKSFRIWFKLLIKEEVFTEHKFESNNSRPVMIYLLDKSKLNKHLRSFEFYKKMKKIVEDNQF